MNSNIINFLAKCQKAYYDGTPILSDAEFDLLAEQYNFYEVGHIDNSPKNKKHLYRMYSLQKVYEEDLSGPITTHTYVTSPKLDGSAISLLYVDGILSLALTRGDGIIGEDITDKLFVSELVPLAISNYGMVQVTGEIVAPSSVPNSRNYVSGALHLKNLDEFLERKDLKFIAYGVYPFLTNSFHGDMHTLKGYAFDTVIDSTWEEYPRDGKVVRIDDNIIFETEGYTAKHPRAAWAIKKRSDVEVLETELLDVVWQLGKGGKVTPVAILETVNIGGADISRATLHNAGFIESLDLSIGDTLLVTRSGGIIPKVVGKV